MKKTLTILMQITIGIYIIICTILGEYFYKSPNDPEILSRTFWGHIRLIYRASGWPKDLYKYFTSNKPKTLTPEEFDKLALDDKESYDNYMGYVNTINSLKQYKNYEVN